MLQSWAKAECYRLPVSVKAIVGVIYQTNGTTNLSFSVLPPLWPLRSFCVSPWTPNRLLQLLYLDPSFLPPFVSIPHRYDTNEIKHVLEAND